MWFVVLAPVVVFLMARLFALNRFTPPTCSPGESLSPSRPLGCINVGQVLCSVVSEKALQYHERIGVKLIGDFPRNLYARADFLIFSHVISNLIHDAFRAIESEEGEIRIEAKEQGDSIALAITDSGRGTAVADLHFAQQSVEAWGGRLQRDAGGVSMFLRRVSQ